MDKRALHILVIGISLGVVVTIILVMSTTCCCKKALAHYRTHRAPTVPPSQQNGNIPIYCNAECTLTDGNEARSVFFAKEHQPADTPTNQEQSRQISNNPILPSYYLLWDTFDIGVSECGDESVIKLQIPPGAVAEGAAGHIDIGVAFNGPFQYPPGLVPVSPVFWLCVRDRENFQFQQPITITVRHCLHVDSCIHGSFSGLNFVMAKHSSKSFERLPADSNGKFTSNQTGVISTKHLSCLCICCENAFDRIEYCLIQVPAESHTTVDSYSQKGFFYISYYITYNLPYCIEAVNMYYGKGKSLRHTNFSFKSQSEEHAFIQVQHAEEISGCHILSRAFKDSCNYSDKKVRR